MNAVPVIPDNAPFTSAQKAWLNGFLAGIFSRGNAGAAAVESTPAIPLTLLYASQTGTSERLAKKALKAAKSKGFAPTLLDAAKCKLSNLSAEASILLLTSTYGDGEAPDSAKGLLSELKQATGKQLSKLRYSVCALGDSNYAKFCQAGKDFDEQLATLGGTRLLERVDCDVGEETKFADWLDKALQALAPSTGSGTDTVSEDDDEDAPKPVEAALLDVRRVSGEGSGKEVNHIAFDLSGTSLSYAAGDALSVQPLNDPALVTEILGLLGCDGEEAVSSGGNTLSLRKALSETCDLGKPGKALLALLGLEESAEKAPHQVVNALLAAKNAKPAAQAFVTALRPLQPRLYSISSSPLAHQGQVHLTVGAVRYSLEGRRYSGVASTFLADRAAEIGKVRIGIHANSAFRLPSDGAKPVIMIGPGTGIAPFRAFIHERHASGAKGANWLFFGDQREATDFLYKDELLPLVATGFLKLSLAWSRDQERKIYVQHRMLEEAAALWELLSKGAHLYVCGDASRMAKDVDAALHEVLRTAGGLDEAGAASYVANLKAEGRYQRDVY